MILKVPTGSQRVAQAGPRIHHLPLAVEPPRSHGGLGNIQQGCRSTREIHKTPRSMILVKEPRKRRVRATGFPSPSFQRMRREDKPLAPRLWRGQHEAPWKIRKRARRDYRSDGLTDSSSVVNGIDCGGFRICPDQDVIDALLPTPGGHDVGDVVLRTSGSLGIVGCVFDPSLYLLMRSLLGETACYMSVDRLHVLTFFPSCNNRCAERYV